MQKLRSPKLRSRLSPVCFVWMMRESWGIAGFLYARFGVLSDDACTAPGVRVGMISFE